MNVHSSLPKRTTTPAIETGFYLNLANEPDAAAKARERAGQVFDRANDDHAKIRADLARAGQQHRRTMQDLAGADRRLEQTPQHRTFPTNEVIKRLSWARLVATGAGCVMIALDMGFTVFSAASYLAASGRIESLADNVPGAILFCFVFVAGVYGLKALGELQSTDYAKVCFTTILLAVGGLALLVFTIGFALAFNPATIAGPAGGDAMGAASPALDPLTASILVFAQLVATVTLGAGIALYVTRALDENKLHHAVKNPEFAQATKAVADLTARCLELQGIVASHAAYLAAHAHDRAAFIASVESKLAGVASYVRAETAKAQHELQSKLNGISLDAVKAARRESV